MKLIVGLGNPGVKYHNTRHNIGFDIIDTLAEEFKITTFKEKFHGLLGEAVFKDEKILLLKPQTYMNLSGNSVNEAVKFYKLNPAEDLIVIYDDMDLQPGQMKIKVKGSSGGHNGIRSIIPHIGEEFIRVKCGIGKAKNREDTVNFVLGRFTKDEMDEVQPMIDDAVQAVQSILTAKEISRVMQKYNKKK